MPRKRKRRRNKNKKSNDQEDDVVKQKPITMECSDYSHSMLPEVNKLLMESYSLSPGCSCWMTENDSKFFESMNAFCSLVKRGDSILGFLLAIPLKLTNKDGDIFSTSVSSYLCVDKSIRKQGYSKKLIKELTTFGTSKGISNSYYTTSRVDENETSDGLSLNSTSVEDKYDSWIRILNPVNAKRKGFHFKSYRRPGDKTNVRDKIKYNIYRNHGVNITDCSHEEYVKMFSESHRYIHKDQWERFQSYYTVKKVECNGKKGMFCLRSSPMSVDGKKPNCNYLVFYAGDDSCILKGSCNQSKDKDVLFLNQTLGMSKSQIMNHMFLRTGKGKYNFVGERFEQDITCAPVI